MLTGTVRKTITFRATDPDELWDDDPATFTVTGVNDAPVVSDIPDQTIAEGASFATINLDDYVSDIDDPDEDMDWSFSGNTDLTVNIVDQVATITTPNADWNGSETITFRATDPGDLFDEDAATFTVTPVNDAPVVIRHPGSDHPGGQLAFTTINLDDYVSDVDDSDASLIWSYSGNTDLSVILMWSLVSPPSRYPMLTGTVRRRSPSGPPIPMNSGMTTLPPLRSPGRTMDRSCQTSPARPSPREPALRTITLDDYVSDIDNTDAEMAWTYSGNTDLTVDIVDRVATITTPDADWNGSEDDHLQGHRSRSSLR